MSVSRAGANNSVSSFWVLRFRDQHQQRRAVRIHQHHLQPFWWNDLPVWRFRVLRRTAARNDRKVQREYVGCSQCGCSVGGAGATSCCDQKGSDFLSGSNFLLVCNDQKSPTSVSGASFTLFFLILQPPTGNDTMVKAGVTTSINTKHQCITAMKEYENKSLEVRLEANWRSAVIGCDLPPSPDLC